MFSYSEEKYLAYEVEDLFGLVSDVRSYPEFLPGCDAVKILSSNEKEIIADLVVRYKGVCAKYTSRIWLQVPADSSHLWVIDVSQQEGPFKFLTNRWEFKWDKDKKATCVRFSIEFEMQSKILNFTIGMMFEKLVVKIVKSFEERAHHILG